MNYEKCFDEIWFKEILLKNNTAKPNQTSPQAYVLGGQPGAGKSMLIQKALNELEDDAIIINGDDYRKYHPEYLSLQEKYAKDSPKYTAEFSAKMIQLVLQKALSKKYNVIIEGTFRTSTTPINTLKNFKDNGYKTFVLIQICDKDISFNSCIERYEKMLKVCPKEARYVDKAHHDEVVYNLAQNIQDVQDSGFADNIRIYSRVLEENNI